MGNIIFGSDTSDFSESNCGCNPYECNCEFEIDLESGQYLPKNDLMSHQSEELSFITTPFFDQNY